MRLQKLPWKTLRRGTVMIMIIGLSSIVYSYSTIKENREYLKTYLPQSIYFKQMAKESGVVQKNKTKLLTLFTTFSENAPLRYNIQNNTLCNYWNIPEEVNRLAFNDENNSKYQLFNTKDSQCVQNIQKRGNLIEDGWNVMNLNSSQTLHTMPIIGKMFSAAIAEYNSKLYMYTNADILYPWKALTNTLHAILEFTKRHSIAKFIILGLRVEGSFVINNRPKDKLKNASDEDILKLGKNLRPTRIYALDYFITSATSYPWSDIPDFIVGRWRYDNWLLMYATNMNITTFDITPTVPAVHQAGVSKPKDGKYKQIYEVGQRYNMDLFVKSTGSVHVTSVIGQCSTWKTQFKAHTQTHIDIVKNKQFEKKCLQRKLIKLKNEMK